MTTTTSSTSSLPNPQTSTPSNFQTDISWKINLFKKNKQKGIAVIIFILVLSIFSGIAAQSIFIAVLALLILSISVSQYFMPLSYHLDDENVIIETPFQKKIRKWDNFKRWEKDKKSIKLLTMLNASRLDNYRAWLLLTEKTTRVAVETLVKEKLG
ncbi:MAG: hypothetical protein KAI81_00470 [Candidatus Marinimicrobia bacterium]|nr:hypothetical protein [Candidatus Neomarinimicrobiota bacterium]